MIYWINNSDCEYSIQEIFESVSLVGDFLYTKNSFFIYVRNFNKKKYDIISKYSPQKIEDKDICLFEDEKILYWCKNMCLRNEINDIEKSEEYQKRLKEVSDIIDKMEKGGV